MSFLYILVNVYLLGCSVESEDQCFKQGEQGCHSDVLDLEAVNDLWLIRYFIIIINLLRKFSLQSL